MILASGISYFKEYLSDYAFADVLQTFVVIGFVIFFTTMIYTVWKRPKNYYNEVSNLPLEDKENLFDELNETA